MNSWISIVAVIILLGAAIPWSLRIRHPEQKPLAAYLIFVSVFSMTAALLFMLLTLFGTRYDLASALENPLPALLFVVLTFLPAVALGTWVARKPPWRKGPPP